jgi:hypothetical protein
MPNEVLRYFKSTIEFVKRLRPQLGEGHCDFQAFIDFRALFIPLSTKSRICCENLEAPAGGISEIFTLEALLVWKTHMDR